MTVIRLCNKWDIYGHTVCYLLSGHLGPHEGVGAVEVAERHKSLSQRRKRRLLAGSAYRCAYCGVNLTEWTATIDHVLPLSRGGTNDRSNLVAACFDCNNAKGNQTVEEWRR